MKYAANIGNMNIYLAPLYSYLTYDINIIIIIININ